MVLDVSQEAFIRENASATEDKDIGRVVYNAGTGNPGEFLKLDRRLLEETLATQHHVAFRHRPLLRREARRAGGVSGLILVGGNGCGKRHSLYGE